MMSINRSLALACAVWMLTFLFATPRAAQVTGDRAEAKAPPGRAPLFTHSENCIACHNNLVSATGEDISIGSSWRSTMMANSSRDPYWQAAVRRETTDHPTQSAAIQDECAECHMPMTTQMARAAGGKGEVFKHLPIAGNDDSETHRLAADSISCTVCHQISAERLGTRESFNGEFVIKPTPADGVRVIFGPYRIDAGRKTIMRSVSGFEQAEAPHIRQSELCATCHTLITNAFGPNGEVVGSLPEQMNYQEWQHSDFNKEQRSCQSCHMPAVQGPVRIASVLGDYRESLARHVFVGGNAFMVRLMSKYRTELGVEALPSEMEATAKATIRLLQEETATVSIARTELAGSTLTIDVDVKNLTGHKFPTGYPSRRTWLHLTVRNAQGNPVFESGAINDAGAIAGNDADADPTKYEPHYDQISSPDQVQIWEPILGDRAGVPTTGLLTATQYLKDNRLLPRGFDKATADPLIGVYGAAAQDASFASEGDRVRYAVAVGAGGGPFTIETELLYQPIGYRWAHNLEKYDSPEPKRFVGYFNTLSSGSWVLIAKATAKAQ